MIIFEKDGKEYKFRNLGSEVSLKEFDKVSQIMTPKSEMASDEASTPKLDKWIKVTELLGDAGLIDVIDSDGLVNLIKNFRAVDVDGEVIDSVTIGSRTYTLEKNDGKLFISGKASAEIEKYFRTKKNWVAYTIAILFKDDQLTNVEHYDPAHLEHKVELLGKELTAEVCAPIIFEVNKQMAESYQQLAELSAKS